MRTLYADPCVLVGGAPRSGTTLVGLILAAHPQAAVLLEDRLTTIVRSVEALASVRLASEDGARTQRFGRPVSFVGSSLAPEDLERLAEFEGYRRCFAGVLRSVFAAAGEKASPRVIGSKLPIVGGWEDVDHLTRVFDDLRLVFVVRNPLDVIVSSLARRAATVRGDDHWHVATVRDAHAEWSCAMHTIARHMRAPGRRAHVLKYEDLCAAPSDVSERLFEFLDLASPPEPHSVRPLSDKARPDPEDARDADYLAAHFQGVDAVWRSSTAEALVDAYADEAPCMLFRERFAFASDAVAPFLTEGFCLAESWGRWTDTRMARIRLRHPPPEGDLTLTLDLVMVRLAPGSAGAPIRARINGGVMKGAVAIAPGALILTFPRAELRPTGVADIEIEILHPKLSDEAPVDDSRALGLGVAAMRFDWSQ